MPHTSTMLAVPYATQHGVDGQFQMPPPTPPPDSRFDITFNPNEESKLISAFPRGAKKWEGLRARQREQPSHFVSAEAMKRMGLSVPLHSQQEITWWSQAQAEQAQKVCCTVVPFIPEGIDLALGTSSDSNQLEAPGATYIQAPSTQQAEPDDIINSSASFRMNTACELIRCAIRAVVDGFPKKLSLTEHARVAAEVIRTPMEILFNKKDSSHGPRR